MPTHDEEPERLVEREGPHDRRAGAPDVLRDALDQARRSGRRVDPDVDAADPHALPARLDDRLHRVGVLAEDLGPHRRLPAERPEPRGGVADIGRRRTPGRPRCRARCRRFLSGEKSSTASMGRSPITRSASPATIGATSSGMQDPSYWLSASVLTITSAPARSPASRPVRKALASPRFSPTCTTWSTPSSRATSAVRSALPSSITSHSTTSNPGTSRGRSASVCGSVSSSL